MTEAGHPFAWMVSGLLGEPLPAIPPATGTSHTHHADGFSPEAEKRITHLFGKDPDDLKAPRKSRT
ncbi:hypothetical protein [Sphaerotilus sp.]|uniref:hypothetical protein n=1 Tax=Sphaerotilus sp. TaxID=2093942 RepID=UPI0034E1EE67